MVVFFVNHREMEPPMNEIMAVGVDLAKNLPQVLGVDTEDSGSV